MSPRAALTKHLLDGDDSFLTGNFEKPVSAIPPTEPAAPTPPAAPPAPPPGVTPYDSDAT
jgi:sec-independent protein translocase protein TatB